MKCQQKKYTMITGGVIMNQQKDKKDKVVTFRMEERQYNQIQEIAETSDRTIAYIVNKICEDHLKERGNNEGLVFSYSLGQQKKTVFIPQYSKEKIMKIQYLEEKCKENKCTIFELLDLLLDILSVDDLERIPTEFSSGYLHEKYGISEE